jgi:ABC-type transport system involved in cytochrome c biogenesis permease subunit
VSATDNPYAADFLERHFAEFACYLVALALSVILLFGLLAPKYRPTSRWLRGVFFVCAVVLPVWSALGFLLLLYPAQFTRQTQNYLFHRQLLLQGTLIGLLISLFLSPDFRKLCRLSPTSSRRASLGQKDLTNR